MEQVPGVDGRRGQGSPDGIEERLVPVPGDRPIWVVRDGRTGTLVRPGPGDAEERADEQDCDEASDGTHASP
jgi:hypothetical protein